MNVYLERYRAKYPAMPLPEEEGDAGGGKKGKGAKEDKKKGGKDDKKKGGKKAKKEEAPPEQPPSLQRNAPEVNCHVPCYRKVTF